MKINRVSMVNLKNQVTGKRMGYNYHVYVIDKNIEEIVYVHKSELYDTTGEKELCGIYVIYKSGTEKLYVNKDKFPKKYLKLYEEINK